MPSASVALAETFPENNQSIRAKLVEHRTYLRPINEEIGVEGLESPSAALNRQINHQRYLWEKAQGTPLDLTQEAELSELRDLLASRRASLSGRVKWMADTSIIKQRAAAAFNCSFTEVQLPADVVDVFWLLLQGCGVGFKPRPGLMSGFSIAIPEIEFVPSARTDRGGAEKTTESFDKVTGEWRLTVGDSAKAWAKLIGKLLTNKFRAKKLSIDFSELRPAGMRLRGYGWISSGWKPLQIGLGIIINVMVKKAGQPLDSIDILDIINALGTVLSSRRSAQICLLDSDSPDLARFMGAKQGYSDGPWWRGQSNNSILFERTPTHEEFVTLFKSIWQEGEPGFYNIAHAKRRAAWAVGTNPCGEIILPSKGFCVSGDTKLITRCGISSISERNGEKIEIWNGKGWSEVEPYKTGDAVTLFRVTANDGSHLDVTANHRFQVFIKDRSAVWGKAEEREVTTLELAALMEDPQKVLRLPEFTIEHNEGESLPAGMSYTTGVFFGDGCVSTASTPSVELYNDKMNLPIVGKAESTQRTNANGTPFVRVASLLVRHAETIKKDISPVFGWSLVDRLAFLAGALDTDGSETGTGGVRLYVGSRSLGEQFQLLLRSVGLRGSLNLMAKKGQKTNLCERKADIWYLQITDARKIPCVRLDVSGGHTPIGKGLYQLVEAVEKLDGLHSSFCLTEPKLGMCVFGNMLTYQCNLVQIVPHRFKTLAELERAIWLMARANYRQTCVDMRDGVLQLPWNDNNTLLRLCGVSFTGYISWKHAGVPEVLHWARKAARRAADSMADELGLNRTALVTQIQPAGTVSKVLGKDGDEIHEGAHGAIAKYIFNRIGFSKHDPLVGKLKAAGYEVYPNPYDEESSVLVTFPVEYSDPGNLFTAIERKVQVGEEKTYLGHGDFKIEPIYEVEKILVNREPAVAQLERYKTLMEHYVDHNCSITISYDEEETTAIIDWLEANWDHVVGISFLKRTDPTLTLVEAQERYGHKYLPQEPVSARRYHAYADSLTPIDFVDDSSSDGVDLQDCASGACPIR